MTTTVGQPLRVRPAMAFLLALALIGPTAIFKGSNLLVLLFALLIAIGIGSVLLSWFNLRSIRCRRMTPAHAEVGVPFNLRYQVERDARSMPSFGIRVSDFMDSSMATVSQMAWVMHVGPGEEVHADARVLPLRRGSLKLQQIELSSSFPFGLIRRRRRIQHSQEVLIYPRRYELKRHVLQASEIQQIEGPRAARRRGTGTEWYGTRPARPGDAYRDIAWKRSARSDDLVSIDRAAPVPSRVLLMLDLRTPTAELRVGADEDAREMEERAISLAASIIQMADQVSCEIGLVVPGIMDTPTPVRGGMWHIHRLLSRLASIDLDVQRSDERRVLRGARWSIIAIRPDRVEPIEGLAPSLSLTARQLSDLMVMGEATA